jgi:hypothetical protein
VVVEAGVVTEPGICDWLCQVTNFTEPRGGGEDPEGAAGALGGKGAGTPAAGIGTGTLGGGKGAGT